MPYLHGKLAWAQQVRTLCNARHFDCIAVDLPAVFEHSLTEAIETLPCISAICAHDFTGPVYYLPVDPCDSTIEALRQSIHRRTAFACTGFPRLAVRSPLPPLPDESAIERIGFDAYTALCLHTIAAAAPEETEEESVAARYCAWRLRQLETSYSSILALVHCRLILPVIRFFGREESYNSSFPTFPSYHVKQHIVNTDHLYFALGELPFITAKYEQQRYTPFESTLNRTDTIKDLFRETRDQYLDAHEGMNFSPARLQTCLTFLRNLTVRDRRIMPSLLDIVSAAKGVGGNTFAVKILANAKYYPFLPYELTDTFLSVGIDRVRIPGESNARPAVNLFRDTAMEWRTIPLKKEPSPDKQRWYRYRWNPHGMCSHVPEDYRIERFNKHLRMKTLQVLSNDRSRTEKFTTSVKDGIDIRDTVRNWYTGDIYVRELFPVQGSVDTVIIVFDAGHDERYPHCATWYAEHGEESTLSFYATDPFEKMVGPGIARAVYGGLSLLFPPRPVPDIFTLPAPSTLPLDSYFHRLVYGAAIFSREKNIACVAPRKPDIIAQKIARVCKKHLLWIPLSTFSTETIRRLRVFHILNGKIVRSWANRFIGD
jgi:hypothetical protein